MNLLDLPSEMLLAVVKALYSAVDLISFACVCTTTKSLCLDAAAWKIRTERDFDPFVYQQTREQKYSMLRYMEAKAINERYFITSAVLGYDDWRPYVRMLLGDKEVHNLYAAIFDKDGSIWAKSALLRVTTENLRKVVNAFTNPLQSSKLLKLGDKTYITIQVDDAHLHAKKGAGGFIVSKSNNAFLLGVYNNGAGVPMAFLSRNVLFYVATYLRKLGL